MSQPHAPGSSSVPRHPGVLTGACVALLACLGIALRFLRVDELSLFGDEIHSLTRARGLGAGWLDASVLIHAGGYAPLVAWHQWLLASASIDEWSFRLPALLPGALLVVLAAPLALRWLRSFEACLAVGWIALAPYLVYLSREARSYPSAVLAFAAATALVLASFARPRSLALPAAAACGALALAFDVAVAPSLATLALLSVAVPYRRSSLRRAALATGLAVAIGIIGVMPLASSLGGLLGDVASVRGGGRASLATAFEAFALGLGLARPLAVLALGAAAFGAWRLFARFPLAVGWLLAAAALQILILLVVQPRGAELPWVFLRYCVHLLPLVMVLIAGGLAPPSRWPAGRQFALAVGLLACFGVIHARRAHYGALGHSNFVAHPLLQSVPAALPEELSTSLLPRFYRDKLPLFEAGGLIEAPLVVSFPLYALYQRAHGRPVTVAALGEGLFQSSLAPVAGLALKRSVHVAGLSAGVPLGARWLVVHKRPWEEMVRAASLLRKAGYQTHQLDPRGTAAIFRRQQLSLPSESPFAKANCFEDAWVAVYDLRISASPCSGSASSSSQ